MSDALKNQLAKAQALIRQFEDGTGRHNSNLNAHGRDGEALVSIREVIRQLNGYAIARAVRLGLLKETDLEAFAEHGVKPRDDVERYLVSRCLLRARPQDCHVGQLVRLEAIEREGRERENWATVIVPTGRMVFVPGDERIVEQVVHRFEFERVRYVCDAEPANDREFWKRVV